MAEGIQSRGALLDRQHDRLLRLSFPQGGEPAGARLVINWRLEVWGQVKGNADFMRPFEIEVVEREG